MAGFHHIVDRGVARGNVYKCDEIQSGLPNTITSSTHPLHNPIDYRLCQPQYLSNHIVFSLGYP
ncbi:MAG: hypothetical protein U9R27_12225 [Campylobacterota bacterium]|nr:hypothetical protein [Campylobacterota bacterium]